MSWSRLTFCLRSFFMCIILLPLNCSPVFFAYIRSNDATREGLATLLLEARAARARACDVAAHQEAQKMAAAAAQESGGSGQELSDAEAAHAMPPVVPRLLDCVRSSPDDDLRYTSWCIALRCSAVLDYCTSAALHQYFLVEG